jgi:hypothetical protein
MSLNDSETEALRTRAIPEVSSLVAVELKVGRTDVILNCAENPVLQGGDAERGQRSCA